MCDMKCPICGNDLEQYHSGLVCYRHCLNGKNVWGGEETLKELDRTRKALEITVDTLKLMYQGNGDPQDIMRYKDNLWVSVRRLCKQTLEQITALEQKE